MTPDRKRQTLPDEVRQALEAARPEQIERLFRDVVAAASNDDFRPTGRA